MVEISVKDDSSGELTDGAVTVKWRSSRPPGVVRSLDAEHGNAGNIPGILKKRLHHAST